MTNFSRTIILSFVVSNLFTFYAWAVMTPREQIIKHQLDMAEAVPLEMLQQMADQQALKTREEFPEYYLPPQNKSKAQQPYSEQAPGGGG